MSKCQCQVALPGGIPIKSVQILREQHVLLPLCICVTWDTLLLLCLQLLSELHTYRINQSIDASIAIWLDCSEDKELVDLTLVAHSRYQQTSHKMADKAVLTLPLNPGGKDVENNNYRTRNAYEGQREREDVYDEGETLNMQMTLVDVIHGTMDPTSGSSPATLFIADFRFISHDRSRRFQR